MTRAVFFRQCDNCYGLSGCSSPCTDLTGFPANGGFYFQASNRSVALPVAGYD